MTHYLLLIALLGSLGSLPARTLAPPPNEVRLTIRLRTDQYPQELRWTLTDLDGQLQAEVPLDASYTPDSLYQWDYTLPREQCLVFQLYDSYGDGLNPPGFYALALDGQTQFSGPFNQSRITHALNCAPSYACDSPQAVAPGVHPLTHDDSWYVFTPSQAGRYQISTCKLADCDTKIWVFDDCSRAHYREDNEGTIAFDDSFNPCAPQAQLALNLDSDKAYFIRIGDDRGDCQGVDWAWSLEFLGQVWGCTDPAACNYDPTATLDDGQCLPFGHPDCPRAPDLLVNQDRLENSIISDRIQGQDDCLVEEGCLRGYGIRDILRFTTRIENIGDADYIVGRPRSDNPLFTYDNCHAHWHFDGYAEYLLFDDLGQEVPIGFKNGFCVADRGCPNGIKRYSCENMGISVGCFDEYDRSLECQWIDVTEVPDGDYTLVVRVNWDNKPDLRGLRELDTLNNWAQVCLRLDRSTGDLRFFLDDQCPPYVDCAGVPYGSTSIDCTGICGGTAKFGDLNGNGRQELEDVRAYLDRLAQREMPTSTCTDLSGDGRVTVYDVALLSACARYGEAHPNPQTGPHNYCRFPFQRFRPDHFTSLSILDYQANQRYLDIGVQNANSDLLGYQFRLDGLEIDRVENLHNPEEFPITPYTDGRATVMGLSLQDSIIRRSSEWRPLVRVYYRGTPDPEVCFGEIVDLVNAEYERINGFFGNPCVLTEPSVTGAPPAKIEVRAQPNPLSDRTELRFDNPAGARYQLWLYTYDGRPWAAPQQTRTNRFSIDARHWPAGLYWYRLQRDQQTVSGKLIVR
ncbi:MAG: lysyl oxidase family protein [Bacteroidota bacterium]